MDSQPYFSFAPAEDPQAPLIATSLYFRIQVHVPPGIAAWDPLHTQLGAVLIGVKAGDVAPGIRLIFKHGLQYRGQMVRLLQLATCQRSYALRDR